MAFLIAPQLAAGNPSFKEVCRAATTADITLSGLQTVDGVSLVADDRVLVKDQSLGENNGIYIVAAGAWARSADMDSSDEVTPGMIVSVTEGTANADKSFILTTDAPIVLGTTPLVFAETAVTDHGMLTGLGDDDHTQYVKVSGRTNEDQTLAGHLLFSPHNTKDIGQDGAFSPRSVYIGTSLKVAALSGVLKATAGLVSGSATTDDLSEGSNLYFTDERAQDAVGGILTDTATIDFSYNDAGNQITADVIPGGISHSALANLLLDAHTQYALLAGRSGGQTLIGGTAASNALTLSSTSNATKGKIFAGANLTLDEANGRFGWNATSPTEKVEFHTSGGGSDKFIWRNDTDGNRFTMELSPSGPTAIFQGSVQLAIRGGGGSGLLFNNASQMTVSTTDNVTSSDESIHSLGRIFSFGGNSYQRFNDVHAKNKLAVGFSGSGIPGGMLHLQPRANGAGRLTGVTTNANASTTLTLTSAGTNVLHYIGVGDIIYLNGISGTRAKVLTVTTSTITTDAALGDGASREIVVLLDPMLVFDRSSALAFRVDREGNASLGSAISSTNGASCLMNFESTTKAVKLTKPTTDASITAPEEGMIIYDATAKKLKFYNGTGWETVTSV